MTENKRYYAFDSLRASMMILGIVIHSAMSYSSSNDMTWPLRAHDTSYVFFILVDFIHSFRMPVFFIVAGFFGAYLFFNNSPLQMLKNRFRCIFLPFIVFLIILNPFILFAFKYCKSVFSEQVPDTVFIHFSSILNYIPIYLYHLWFLYYLFLISVLVYLFSILSKYISLAHIDCFFESTFKYPLIRLLILISVSFVILFTFGNKSFETSVSWIPNLGVLTYYFAFYLTGWFLFIKKEIVSNLKSFDILTTVIGVIVFCLKLYYYNDINFVSFQIINSIITCSLSLGIIGLFLRFTDFPNNSITYFVNSAYWVYLIHFFFAVFLTGLLDNIHISVYLKFLIVFFVTTIISLTSYHLFVRKTVINDFFNGKSYK